MIGRFSRSLLKLAAWLAVAGAVTAQDLPPIEGSQTSEFQEALSGWLNGNDLQSLSAFSALAQGGNIAAQIMLGRISEDASLFGHLTATMPRKERIELLRQPGGLSGKSWLLAAAPKSPLAAAFLGANRLDERADAVGTLFGLGEPSAAMKAGSVMLYRGEARALLVALAGESALPKEAKFLEFEGLRLIGAKAYVGSSRTKSMGLGADPRLPADVLLTWLPPTPLTLVENPDLLKWSVEHASTVRAWTPLASFCAAHCPNSKGTCTVLGAALVSGSQFPFESPTERLLPDEVYWASSRMEGDLVRKYEDMSDRDWHGKLAGIDACFMPAVAEIQAQMRP